MRNRGRLPRRRFLEAETRIALQMKPHTSIRVAWPFGGSAVHQPVVRQRLLQAAHTQHDVIDTARRKQPVTLDGQRRGNRRRHQARRRLKELQLELVRVWPVSRDVLPPCWYRHESLIRVLSAARDAYAAAFEPTQVASAAADNEVVKLVNKVIIDAYWDCAGAAKTISTFIDSALIHQAIGPDGRLRSSWNSCGTDTGRFSCVSGDTLLPTSRGIFRLDEYDPQVGDLVLTHKNRWRPVLRKIYKGTQDMYRIVLSNGAHVTCTQKHQLLTPGGWCRVEQLQVGSEVCSNVSEQGVSYESREGFIDPQDVPLSGETYDSGAGREARHSQR